MTTFNLYAGDELIATATKTFNFKRYSQKCSAIQRHLDKLCANYRNATRAVVDEFSDGKTLAKFNIVNGISQFHF